MENRMLMGLSSTVPSVETGQDYYLQLEKLNEYSEKMKEEPFSQFDDKDMILYFIHRRKNIDSSKDLSKRTRIEYQRELLQMIQNMFTYPNEIGLDIDNVKEGSFFKSLSSRHIKRYIEWVQTKSPRVKERGPYSPATLARKTAVIKNFFSFLYKSQYIKEPIYQNMLSATVLKQERPNRDLSPNEVLQLLDFFKKENHPILFGIIHILVTTGLRNEEFCNLKISDLRYDRTVGMYYLNVIGKGNKERKIPVRNKTFESINNFRAARLLPPLQLSLNDHSVLLPNSRGNAYTPSHLSRYLSDAIERTGLEFTKERTCRISPHTLRHCFVIISHKAGADIYTIMRSLGHSKIETTQIYMSHIFELEEHAVNKWDEKVLRDYI